VRVQRYKTEITSGFWVLSADETVNRIEIEIDCVQRRSVCRRRLHAAELRSQSAHAADLSQSSVQAPSPE